MLQEVAATDSLIRGLRDVSDDAEVNALLQALRLKSRKDWLILHQKMIVMPARGWLGRGAPCRHTSFWQLYLRDGEKYLKVQCQTPQGALGPAPSGRDFIIGYLQGRIDASDDGPIPNTMDSNSAHN